MQIRPLTTVEECRHVATLERVIWGYTDAEDVVPPPVLIVSARRGGILLGAFDDEDRMIGFVYSIPAVKDGRLSQWSHMLGVLPDARDTGVGARLKLAQRDAARQAGFGLIEWTFDPLQALNAHFNFAKLGVVVHEYEENAYGESTSPLHAATPTDRFIAEWHVALPHVERRLASWNQPVVRDQSIAQAPLVNPSVAGQPWIAPGSPDLSLSGRRMLVEIPVGFGEMQLRDPGLALQWRLHTRDVFQSCFARGYRAVDFFLSKSAGRGHYLLSLP